MDRKIFVLAIIFVAIILISGCVQQPSKQKKSENEIAVEKQTVAPVEEQPIAAKEIKTNVSAKACSVNIDCDDANACTTDSCMAGVCKNVVEAGCQIKTEEKPYISDANFGAFESEFVTIKGKNWKIDSWKVVNGKGEVYMTFPKYTTINGQIMLHSSCSGITTEFGSAQVHRYLCKDNDFFSDAGDKAILKDEVGNKISEKAQ